MCVYFFQVIFKEKLLSLPAVPKHCTHIKKPQTINYKLNVSYTPKNSHLPSYLSQGQTFSLLSLGWYVTRSPSYMSRGPFLNLQSGGALPFRGRAEESEGISCQPCRWRSRRSDDSWGKPAVLQEVMIEMIERWMHLEMHPINQVNTSWIHQHQPSVFAMHHLPAGWSIITARVLIWMARVYPG